MKNIDKFLTTLTIVTILFATSCSMTKKYEQVKATNSITTYENYLVKYPKSKYANIAKQELALLIKERDWRNAKYYNTINKYKDFISEYPESDYISEAENRIKELVEIQAWEKAKSLNIIYGYENYLTTFPNSKYVFDAKNKIIKLKEEIAWSEAVRIGTITAYKKFISDFQYGEFLKAAEKKIIDLEVDDIFKGDHGNLPPMNSTSSRSDSKAISKIEVFNNTEYTLTLRYSGTDSKKLIFEPKQKKTFELNLGLYRVAATVNIANIRNYAGIEEIHGGTSYDVQYYVETKRY